MSKVSKKVKLDLCGLDGNAFVLMGNFQRQAKREGWTSEEIKEVIDKAKSGGYDNLVSVLMDHCDDSDSEEAISNYKED